MRSLAIVFLLAVLASHARAQPGITPSQPFEQPQPPPQLPAAKDEGTATLAALGATGLGYLMVIAGIHDANGTIGWTGIALTVIGPSAGHIYAGENAHAGMLSLVRAGALLTVALGFAEGDDTDSKCVYNHCGDTSGGGFLIAAGALTFVGATIYDLWDAHRAAARTNTREWMVTPAMMSVPGSRAAPALAVAGSF